jgi:hypothetical protein
MTEYFNYINILVYSISEGRNPFMTTYVYRACKVFLCSVGYVF